MSLCILESFFFQAEMFLSLRWRSRNRPLIFERLLKIPAPIEFAENWHSSQFAYVEFEFAISFQIQVHPS